MSGYDMGVIPLTIGNSFILPPALGDGGGPIPLTGDNRMSLDTQLSRLSRRNTATRISRGENNVEAVSPIEQERREQMELEYALRHGHELIMVVPWPLKSRALCVPPPSICQ
jgi:hypothetical protein